MRADGCSAADIEAAVSFARTRMDLIRGTKPFAELEKLHPPLMKLAWFDKYVHACDEALFYSARRIVELDTEPWWAGVHCPVLAIYGDKDTSTGPPEPLVTIIQRGLAKASNRNLTVKIFYGADHSLCKAKTGGHKEVREGEPNRPRAAGPDFVDGYLDLMTAWLEKRAPK
jgi:pimeloyl-ACP methyl ester carboxylesterase